MGDNPLYIAFFWHMHQPYYKDPFTGVMRLPWVRLHGIKDYLDMVKILEEFPAVHQTFNVVPSMLTQLTDYLEGTATDKYLELTLRPPQDLTEDERAFILENFFLANWDNMIKPYPRYYELLVKRGLRISKSELPKLARYFTDNDIRDLQTLFNLTWIDPMFRKDDAFLAGLERRGRDFTEDDKRVLIQKQMDILKGIIPEYRKMSDSGQIELSVTPFYHPILPLLWDTDCARMGMPDVRLPPKRFSHPEDAVKQIRMAVEYFEKVFGHRPAGMWPSEGSVSEDVVRAIRAEGIKWIATDEEVLARSLERALRSPEGYLTEPQTLYRPHQYADVSILFRDHKLSDQIGFVYSGWEAQRAVDDFMGKLAHIRESLPHDKPYIVPVILDGENAWEYYENDGQDFLRGLYSALSNDGRFRAVTFSEFLNAHGGGEPLRRLHAGSWINSNFGIWLGHEEDNMSWDYLSQTREDLEAFAEEHPDIDLSEAWNAIYAAEGSDWNWWYGDEHSTDTQEDFDELFRFNLMKVYKVMGKDIPPNLYVPILLEDRKVAPAVQIRGFVNPTIDGLVTSYFEWYQGAYIDVKRSGGSMHKSESFVDALYYGFNKDNLYLRIDPVVPFAEIEEHIVININFTGDRNFNISFDLRGESRGAVLREKVSGEWTFIRDIMEVAAADIFEIGIPFADIGSQEGEEVSFALNISKNGDEVERCPWRGYITLIVPSPHYETMMWY